LPASWYPNPIFPLNGNFIQRHAQTLARQHQVSVIHVYRDRSINNQFEIKTQINGNLLEVICAYKSGLFKFAFSAIAFYKAYKSILKQRKKPDIVFWNVFFPLAAHMFWFNKVLKVPNFAFEHWTGYHINLPQFNPNHLHLKVARKASVHCQKVMSVSKNLNYQMERAGVSHVKGVVYNVVDSSIFTYKFLENEGFTWLHISSLKDEHKNVTMLLKAFAQLAKTMPCKLCIINSADEKSLLPLVDELNIKYLVDFTGVLSMEKVAEKMQDADAFVLSSNYENMPCVIEEALCCGLPIVSTNVGGINEIIDRENGILVPAADQEELTNAMMRLMKNYQQYDKSNISKKAHNLFSQDAILQQFNLKFDF